MINRFFLGVLMMLACMSAHAGEWAWSVSGVSGNTNSAANACRMAFSKVGATLDFSRVQLNPIVYSAYWGHNVQDGRCYGRSKSDPTGPEYGAESVIGHEYPECPTGQFRQWNNLSCGATQQPAPGAPSTPPPVVCTKGKTVDVTYEASATSKPPINGSSAGGCEINIVDVKNCFKGTDGKTYCRYTGEQTGNQLSSGGPGIPPTVDSPPVGTTEPERVPVPPFTGQPGGGCPKGTVQGGVGPDGIPMCVGTGTTPQNTPPAPPKAVASTTTANPDGSSTTTTTTTTTNADGSTTKVIDKVTTAPPSAGGTVTTEQTKSTSATPAGAPGAETKPPEQTNFCKQNPTLSICRESSVSGTCGQTACIGDAIQCATLRAAAMMQCKQAEDEAALKASPAKSLGDSILAGTDPAQAQIDAAIKGTTVDIGSQKLDQSGFLGAGGCIAPKTFNVMGKAVVMDFATACDSAQPARYIILALGFLAGYLIISKSVLGS